MAATTLLSPDRYLAAHWLHGRLQHLLSVRLHSLRFCGTEVRMRLTGDLFRIPDLAVFSDVLPVEQVPASPPFIVIEITSPDDRHQELLQKLEEYRAWGVRHVWVVEPELKKFYVYNATGLAQTSQFELPQLDFLVIAAELFAEAGVASAK